MDSDTGKFSPVEQFDPQAAYLEQQRRNAAAQAAEDLTQTTVTTQDIKFDPVEFDSSLSLTDEDVSQFFQSEYSRGLKQRLTDEQLAVGKLASALGPNPFGGAIGPSTLLNVGQPGPWRDNYNFPDGSGTSSQLEQAGPLDGVLDVTGALGTPLTVGFLLSHLPQGGIEISSQRLLFNTVDTITGFTEAGRLTQVATSGVLGALPVFTEFNSPTFSVLGAGENVANGNLGIAF